MGALTAPTRVDAVGEEVDALKTEMVTQIDALRTEVETLVEDLQIDVLRTEVDSASTLSNALRTEVDSVLRTEIDVLRTEVDSASTLSNALRTEVESVLRTEIDVLRTEVETLRTEPTSAQFDASELARYFEDLRTDVVDALRTQVEELMVAASSEFDALRTQVQTLVDTPQAHQGADVDGLGFLVETLAEILTSVPETDEIEILNTQVEVLQEVVDCSNAQTEIVRQHVAQSRLLFLVPSSSSSRLEESCGELLDRLGAVR